MKLPKRAIKILLWIVAGATLIVGSLPLLRLGLMWATYGNWNKTFVALHDGSMQAMVHGYTDSPINGWTEELIWKKENDKWFVYYLDHETFGFEKYDLKLSDDHIEVWRDGAILGKLDTRNGEFFHYKQKLLYKKPIDVIHDSHIENQQKWLHWNPS